MSGGRLEVKAHISHRRRQRSRGHQVRCYVPPLRARGGTAGAQPQRPPATRCAMRTRDLGVTIVDIGAGTTDVGDLHRRPRSATGGDPDRRRPDHHDGCIYGARHAHHGTAEEIKIEFGVQAAARRPGRQPRGARPRRPRAAHARRQALAGVIEPRVEEIYSLVHRVDPTSGCEELLSSGIVVTGGAAVMPNMVELGEDIFLKPVRKGHPDLPRPAGRPRSLNPRSAAIMGLLEEARGPPGSSARLLTGGSVQTLFSRAKGWFLGNF